MKFFIMLSLVIFLNSCAVTEKNRIMGEVKNEKVLLVDYMCMVPSGRRPLQIVFPPGEYTHIGEDHEFDFFVPKKGKIEYVAWIRGGAAAFYLDGVPVEDIFIGDGICIHKTKSFFVGYIFKSEKGNKSLKTITRDAGTEFDMKENEKKGWRVFSKSDGKPQDPILEIELE